MKPILFSVALFLSISAAGAGEDAAYWTNRPNVGYYHGLSILYPYVPVYCPSAEPASGQCYSYGDLYILPKSSPLPPGYKYCTYAAHGDLNLWFYWKPRMVELYEGRYPVCFFEDRGEPRDMPEDNKE